MDVLFLSLDLIYAQVIGHKNACKINITSKQQRSPHQK